MSGITITKEHLSEMITHARETLPHEACGILAGVGQTASRLYRMENAEPTAISYVMEPAEQFRVMKEMRLEGLSMVAIYHSHPDSAPYPSPTDIRLAVWDEPAYVIVSLAAGTPEVRAFYIQEGKVREARLTVRP